MDKYTFVNELNACLKGKIDSRELDDTMKYYKDYIDMEIRKGKSESEVLEMLGSPRLLAKTIIMAKGNDGTTAYEEYRSDEQPFDEQEYGRRRRFRMPFWFVLLIFFFVVVFIVSFAFKVLTIFAPVILLFMAIGLVVKLIRDA